MRKKAMDPAPVIYDEPVDSVDHHFQGDQVGGELGDHDVALRPTPVELREPDAQLLAFQVGGSVNTSPMSDGREREIMECAVASYAALEPRNAIESLLGR